MEDRAAVDLRLLRPPLQPGEERFVGRLQPMPDLLDLAQVGLAPLGKPGLRQARRDAAAVAYVDSIFRERRDSQFGVGRVLGME